MSFITGLTAEVEVCFSEGDKEVKQGGEVWLRKFLETLPTRVDFTERGANDDEQHADASFAAPNGFQVNSERLEHHNRVLAYQTKNSCDYTTALAAVPN